MPAHFGSRLKADRRRIAVRQATQTALTVRSHGQCGGGIGGGGGGPGVSGVSAAAGASGCALNSRRRRHADWRSARRVVGVTTATNDCSGDLAAWCKGGSTPGPGTVGRACRPQDFLVCGRAAPCSCRDRAAVPPRVTWQNRGTGRCCAPRPTRRNVGGPGTNTVTTRVTGYVGPHAAWLFTPLQPRQPGWPGAVRCVRGIARWSRDSRTLEEHE